MESLIDQRYRLILLEHNLENNKEALGPGAFRKWQFICPFCGPLGCSESKRRERKAVLLWNAVQNSWVFSCAKKGSVECMNGKTLGNLISALNPALGEAYRRERLHSGTTGKGHNCKAPERLVGVSTASYGLIRSTGQGVIHSNKARADPAEEKPLTEYLSILSRSDCRKAGAIGGSQVKTITIRLPDVEAAMLVEVQKRHKAYRDIRAMLLQNIKDEYARIHPQ